MPEVIDLTSQEAGLKQCLRAPVIRWRHTDVACLDFHARGKARQAWDRVWSPKRDGLFHWDHVIRAQVTPKAQEFVLIKAYRSPKDFAQTRGLPYRTGEAGFTNVIRAGFKQQDHLPISTWAKTTPDYALRVAVGGWRKHNGMCGRVLFAFACTDTSERAEWQDLIETSHRQYGLTDDHSLQNRIYHYFYEA